MKKIKTIICTGTLSINDLYLYLHAQNFIHSHNHFGKTLYHTIYYLQLIHITRLKLQSQERVSILLFQF